MDKIDRRTFAAGIAASSLVLLAGRGVAQAASGSAAINRAVVEAAANVVRAQYLDPAMADRMADLLLANLRTGHYRPLSPVQLAARLCAQAEPGQILVSNVVADLCLGKNLKFYDTGHCHLKGFDTPIQTKAVEIVC